MRDEYGFTKPESFGAPEWEEATDDAQHEQPEAPAPVEDAPEPEPAPLGYIECRVEQWSVFDGFNIQERPKIELRPRLPEDGDADFRLVKTPPPIPILVPKEREPLGREEPGTWLPGVDPQLLRRFTSQSEEPSRPDAMSYQSYMRGGFAR